MQQDTSMKHQPAGGVRNAPRQPLEVPALPALLAAEG